MPFNLPILNALEIMNEVCFLSISYLILDFTDY
jgi:predicted membrane protein